MNRFSLANKTILITGASSGIGKKTAIEISKMGANVILSGRNIERLNDTKNKLKKGNHQLIAGNLLEEETINSITKNVPMLDGVLHAAGVVNPYPIKFLTKSKINETMNINFEVPVLLTAHLLKKKKINNNASFVFLSSISAHHPHKGGAMYGSSKAAIETFSKVLSSELAAQKIRSNCISPAMVKTDMFTIAEQGLGKEAMQQHINQYPLGVGYPLDVANAIIFLLSDAARWITGINLTLDGGYLIGGNTP